MCIDGRQIDPTATTSWLQGRLDFSGLPLAEAIAEANRYSAVKLRLGDPRLADLPVGGSFRTGDNAGIAAAFSTVFPVRVRSEEHTSELQSIMRISYAVFCLKKKKKQKTHN